MTIKNSKEKAVLVGLYSKNERRPLQSTNSLDELKELADTAGAEVIEAFSQARDSYESSTLIGKGKLEEIALFVEDHEIDVVIFNHELSPRQKNNIEQILPCKVLDRTQLILDIFALRANTHEGKLQVQLAQLQYMLPRLTGKGVELSRLGGGIGTRGPGETKIEVDRRKIRDQITKITKELQQIKKQRELERKLRIKQEVTTVALVGYTNAGKSSLFNLLYRRYHTFPAKADVFAEDKLFATLDTTIRMIEIADQTPILLVDTVGFIQDLPHHLVAAFRSTLEEVVFADILLIVVDISDPDYLHKIETVEKVLMEIGVTTQNILYVYNKIDLCRMESMDEWKSTRDGIEVSAITGQGINQLIASIQRMAFQEYERVKIFCPFELHEAYSHVYKFGKSIIVEETDTGWNLSFHAKTYEIKEFIATYENRIDILERESYGINE